VYSWRTTISCRCIARIVFRAAALLAALIAPGVPVAAQNLPDTVDWSVTTAAAPSGAPILSGRTLVVPLTSGVVTAYRMADGSSMWSTPLAADKPLAADEERVYVSAGGAIHALALPTGTGAWRVDTGGPLTAAPLAHGGWLIAAAAGELLAIRASDGHVVWRRKLGPIEFAPSLDGDLLVVSLVAGRVMALDIRDGSDRWQQELGAEPGEPFVIGGRVYFGTKDKLFYTLKASSGRVESHMPIGAEVRGRAVVDDRHVYFASMDNLVRAVRRGDGSLSWHQGLPYRPAAGPVLLASVVVVPGQIEVPLPAFMTSSGLSAGSLSFGAYLVALPLFTRLADGRAAMVGITGGLENKWTMTLKSASLVPRLPLAPITALPGEALPAPRPPDRR
jgi:outer membrane protein assembly factor BamB